MSSSDDDGLIRVSFPLAKDDDGYPPADWEHLWAEAVGPDQYRILNTPFFVWGIGLSDVVIARPDGEGRLFFVELKARSAHTTVRVVLFRTCSDTRPLAARMGDLRERLHALGASSELSQIPNLVAVDVPPGIDLSGVTDLLDTGEAQEVWEYEISAPRG